MRVDGGRPTSRGRQGRLPVPLALCSRTQAPRAGGLDASFRSEWGGGADRRRQAHEQGLAACGVLGTGRFGSMQTHPHPTSRVAAVPTASAVGSDSTHPSPMSGVTGVLWRCVMGCGWMEMEREVRWHMEMWAQALPPQGWGVTRKGVFPAAISEVFRRLPGGPRRLSRRVSGGFLRQLPGSFPHGIPRGYSRRLRTVFQGLAGRPLQNSGWQTGGWKFHLKDAPQG